jgi:hypothetical protein
LKGKKVNKKLSIIIVTIIFLFPSLNTAQITNPFAFPRNPTATLTLFKIDTTDISTLRHIADSSNNRMSIVALLFLAERGYYDIIPTLKERYYQNNRSYFGDAIDCLVALNALHDSDTYAMTQNLVDSMLVYYIQNDTVLIDFWIDAIGLLQLYKDYSRYELIVSLVDRKQRFGDRLLWTLDGFGESPEYRSAVYNRLIQFLNDSSEDYRRTAIRCLVRYDDFQNLDSLLSEAAISNQSTFVRWTAIGTLLRRYDEDYTVIRACELNAKTTRDTMLFEDCIYSLRSIPSPYALAALKNISTYLPVDGQFHDDVNAWIASYVPPSNYNDSNFVGILDSLMEYKHQLNDIGWLSDQTFVSELDSNLTTARHYFVQGDSNNCARQIKLFQQKVDEEYRDSLDGDNKIVTIEGWKFLYYNAQYILDRLPSPPPQYKLNLNTIGNGTVTPSSVYTLYDSATTVTLTATAGTGYKFSGWSGDAVGTTNPISVLMNSEKTITATFVKE